MGPVWYVFCFYTAKKRLISVEDLIGQYSDLVIGTKKGDI